MPPPLEVTVALKISMRPAGSVNEAEPVTAPVSMAGLPTVGDPATGVPAPTATVMVWSVLLAPLDAVMVKVSVVLDVAVCR